MPAHTLYAYLYIPLHNLNEQMCKLTHPTHTHHNHISITNHTPYTIPHTLPTPHTRSKVSALDHIARIRSRFTAKSNTNYICRVLFDCLTIYSPKHISLKTCSVAINIYICTYISGFTFGGNVVWYIYSSVVVM